MNNIFKTLRQLLKDEYDFRVEIESIGFTVILSKEMYEDDFEIPITYGFEDFVYVNFDKFNQCMRNANKKLTDFDYGYDIDDINAISIVMKWMVENADMIIDYMRYCDKTERDNDN